MPYCRVAVNAPLPPLTYFCEHGLEAGRRVLVPFRKRTVAGVVWESGTQADLPAHKILPVQHVFHEEALLPEAWRELTAFAARYYHYPLGQTVFAALPQSLRGEKSCPVPPPEPHYSLNENGFRQPAPPARFAKRHALWQALVNGGGTLAELKTVHAQAAACLREWQEAGWLNAAVPPLRLPAAEHALNAVQTAAAADIAAALGGFQTFLLHGITGSGKTEVYFDAAARVLASGGQVLFLLPEINLTPQLLARAARRFGNAPTAVLHSRSPAAQRGRDYLRALTGQARLVIGTRLAVFTPLPHLGLIVVDEEHDPSFKQDNDLRYHARDLAVWRARQAACPIVLGSATPSLESWHKAQNGGYRLLSLPQRAVRGARLPEISLIDIRKQKLDNGLSAQALSALQDNFRTGGLSLVYLNRRGFAPALFCGDCGHGFGCPNCSAKLVLHRRARQLHCHHCGLRQAVPPACPDCGNQDLSALGQGTQRVEETLRRLLPEARVLRIDRDSMGGAAAWDEVYGHIGAGRADILVGTQMLAKGHDFAGLNLVVAADADGALYSSDFRAAERLFAGLVQVAGRAGRSDGGGRVLVQTRLPGHEVMTAVKTQDYAAFAARTLAQRAELGFPPFAFQAAVYADAPAWAEAAAFLQAAEVPPADGVWQSPPLPMTMLRLAGRERAVLRLESASRQALHRAVSAWENALRGLKAGRVRWHVEIDPQE